MHPMPSGVEVLAKTEMVLMIRRDDVVRGGLGLAALDRNMTRCSRLNRGKGTAHASGQRSMEALQVRQARSLVPEQNGKSRRC